MTKKMGGFPALQAFLARHYIGKKKPGKKMSRLKCFVNITVGETKFKFNIL